MNKINTVPKIIFVDGFNTVGKNYFIEELTKALEGRYAVRLTDPRVWLPAFQKNRRFWDFVHRSAEENQAIFQAHIHHLRSLRRILDSELTTDSVIVTNRSFLTPLIYNFLPSQHGANKIGGDDEIRMDFLRQYSELFRVALPDIPTLFVNLNELHNSEGTIFQDIQQIKRNITERGSSEILYNDWYLYYLIDQYRTPSDIFKGLFTHWEDARSDWVSKIACRYFPKNENT